MEIIEQIETKDGILSIVSRDNMLALRNGNIGYSCIYTDDSIYQPILIIPQRLADAFGQCCTIKEAAVLGGGCCTFPRFLIKRFANSIQIDSIEYLPTIIELTRKYFLTDIATDKLKLINDDSYVFIHNTQKKYDFVLVDMFVGNMMSKQTNTSEFLLDLELHTTENSMVVFNGYNTSVEHCKALCKLGLPYFKSSIVKDEDGTLFIVFVKGSKHFDIPQSFNMICTI